MSVVSFFSLRKRALPLVLVALCMNATSAYGEPKATARKTPKETQESFSETEIANIRLQMLKFRDEAMALIPFAFEEDEKSPKNAETQEALERFAANAAPQKHGQLFNSNPMAKETFDILSQTLKESAADYKQGRTGSSKMLLKAAFHTCLSCHASGLTKTSFRFADTESLAAKAESPLQKAQIHFVFRDFNKAREEARNVLKSPPRSGAQNPVAAPWSSRDAMELVLSTSILLEETPESLSKEISEWQKNLVLSESLGTEVEEWKASLTQWAAEPKVSTPPSLAKLRALVGQKKGDDLLPYQSNLVNHLRARTSLSRLAGNPAITANQRAETLHLLGLIYRAQDNNVFLGFADAYFTSCIRMAPKSARARQCFASLRASIVEANTGSSGTHLENAEKETLLKMGKLAGVRKPLP